MLNFDSNNNNKVDHNSYFIAKNRKKSGYMSLLTKVIAIYARKKNRLLFLKQ